MVKIHKNISNQILVQFVSGLHAGPEQSVGVQSANLIDKMRIDFILAEHLRIGPGKGLIKILLQIKNGIGIGFILPDRQLPFHVH